MQPLPREVIEALTCCSPAEIIAWQELKSGLGSKWGQTYLLLSSQRYFALTHESFSDPLRLVDLDPRGENTIILERYEETLHVREAGGTEYRIQIYDLERPGVTDFLEALNAVKDSLPDIPATEAADEPNATNADSATLPITAASLPPDQATIPAGDALGAEVDESLEELRELPEDPTTVFVMDKLERLLYKGNQYLQLGTDNDPLERLGAFLEDFFIRQGEKAFHEGEADRTRLVEKLMTLREGISARLDRTKATPLTPALQHDLETHVRTGKLLGKRKATWAQAITAFEQALSLDPNHFDALTELATILSSKGAVSEARNLFTRAKDHAATDAQRAFVNQQLGLLPPS